MKIMNTFFIQILGWILLVFSIFFYVVTKSQFITGLVALTGLLSISYGLLYQGSTNKSGS
ncbi:hypothetical protein KXS12_25220 [Priestia filamentosa]|uniref:hypothetical protein n=1 Tax=Priestia filamentosa TaxID=1402861 RepID=UPI00058956F2|nr:hypothetical protein B1B01_23730 [Priestia filamentosa]RJS62676.1 hypothetical protein CJ485_25120 [Priestia filamentosa]SMF71128.1 hypothetical protein SAMN06296056_11260 [Priestia filamentosa]